MACSMVLLLGISQFGLGSLIPPSKETKLNESSRGDPTAVPKTVFSDKLRLVFMVGMEGAGHHYVTDAAGIVFRKHPSMRLHGKLFQNPDAFYLPVIMRESSAAFGMAMDEARSDMRKLAERAEHVPSSGILHIMNGLSFPAGHGNQRVMQYMDPRLVAEAAEAGGVDLRFLYLKRSARELLLADTVHRHFQDDLGKPPGSHDSPQELFTENVRIMLTDAAVVQSFLGELDPAFVACHDWDLFGDREQAKTIGNFLAPSRHAAAWVKTALVSSASGGMRHDPNETLPFDRDDVFSSRLQRKLDSFQNKYCDRKIT